MLTIEGLIAVFSLVLATFGFGYTIGSKKFASSSNWTIYCPDCRKRITRRQTADCMRKMRVNVTR